MNIPNRLTKHQIDIIITETSKGMEEWIHQSTLPSYTEQWFKQARDEAIKSNFHTAKVGCVIVYKNHVIGKGHNQHKTDPLQKEYNQKYREWSTTETEEYSQNSGHTLHAEIDALKSIPYTVSKQVIWRKVQVYIYRAAPGLEKYSGLALPCSACAHAMQDIGIIGAYYTTGNPHRPFGYCEL